MVRGEWQKFWRIQFKCFSGLFWRMQSCAGNLIRVNFPMMCLYFFLPTGLEISQIKVFLVFLYTYLILVPGKTVYVKYVTINDFI